MAFGPKRSKQYRNPNTELCTNRIDRTQTYPAMLPVSVKTNTPLGKRTCEKSVFGAPNPVSAAGLKGKGSPEGSVCFTDTDIRCRQSLRLRHTRSLRASSKRKSVPFRRLRAPGSDVYSWPFLTARRKEFTVLLTALPQGSRVQVSLTAHRLLPFWRAAINTPAPGSGPTFPDRPRLGRPNIYLTYITNT